MSDVFTYRMPAGVPGECTRLGVLGTTIKPEIQNASTPVTAYGQVVTIDGNGVRPIAAGDTSAPAVLGVSVRPFPGQDYTAPVLSFTATPVPDYGAGTPPAVGVVDMLVRGYISMKLNGAAAAVKGAPVYVYYGTSTGTHVQAGVEAAAGANLWLLPGAYFTGAADANGNTEIAFNI